MIVAGFGFRKHAKAESLSDAYALIANEYQVSAIATLSDKADSAPFRKFARSLALPVCRVSEEDASKIETRTNSAFSLAERQTGSVAEATALAAAGPGAELVHARVISVDGMATCALARGSGTGESK